MNSKSKYAIILGILGFVSFLVAHFTADTSSGESLTTLQNTMFYVFLTLGSLMFIFSIVLGVKGYKHHESSTMLRYTGVLITPLLIILAIAFMFLIGNAAFN